MADYEESQLDYIRPEPSHSRSDLSLCATLLSLFDFGAHGYVTRKDWDRGLSTLLLGGLSEDESLWVKLLELYDPEDKGAVKLAAVRDLLPIDPRISVLLQQLVHSVAGCREYVAQATKKAQRDTDLRAQRAVINLRKRLLAPIFSGWAEGIRAEKTLKRKAARYMRQQGIAKAFNSWIDLVDHNALLERKRHRMGRILRRMQSRGVSMAMNRWLEMIDERDKAKKLVRRALSGSLLRSWNTWAEHAEKHAWLKRVIYRGLNAQVTRAFNSIRDSADDARRMRSIGARAFGGPLVRAFNTWLASLGEMTRMKRFLRRALNRGLARSWSRWLEMLDERAVMAKFARRALNRDLARGWESWHDMLEQRARMRGIGKRLQHAGLARAWNAWIGHGGAYHTAHSTQHKRPLTHPRQHAHGEAGGEAPGDCAHNLAYPVARTLSNSLFPPPSCVLVRADDLDKLRRVMGRGLQGQVLRAFNKWNAVCEQLDWLRKKAQTVLGGGVGRAWRAWIELLDERERKMKLMRKAFSGSMRRAPGARAPCSCGRARPARPCSCVLPRMSVCWQCAPYLWVYPHLSRVRACVHSRWHPQTCCAHGTSGSMWRMSSSDSRRWAPKSSAPPSPPRCAAGSNSSMSAPSFAPSRCARCRPICRAPSIRGSTAWGTAGR